MLVASFLVGCGDDRPDPVEVNPDDPVCKTESADMGTVSGGGSAWDITDLLNPNGCCNNYSIKCRAVNSEGVERWLIRVSVDTDGDGYYDVDGLEWFRLIPGTAMISLPGRVTDLSNTSQFEINGIPCGGELLLEFMSQRDDGSGTTRTDHSKRITIRCSNEECDSDKIAIEDVYEFVAEPEFEPTADVMERIEFQSTLDFSELIKEIKE